MARLPCKAQGRRAKRGEFLRGVSLKSNVATVPRIMVPREGPWLAAIIEDLLPRNEEPRSLPASSQRRAQMGTSPEDKGRN